MNTLRRRKRLCSLRILCISHCGVRGGTGLRALEIARGLTTKGHNVDLLVRNDKDIWTIRRYLLDGVNVQESPLGRGERYSALESMPWDFLCRLYIAANLPKLDAVIAFDMLPNIAIPFYFLRWRDRPICIVDWADLWTDGGILDHVRRPQWMRDWSGRLERKSKLEADCVTTISQYLHDRAVSLGVDPGKLKMVPAGADVNRLKVLDKAAARVRVGFGQEWRIIGALASIGAADDVLIELVVPILREDPACYFVIVGHVHEAVKELVERAGLASQILFIGYLSDSEILNTYLSAIDVFALAHEDNPNNWARWPQRVGSFLAVGRPFVTNRVGEMVPFLESHPVGVLASDLDAGFRSSLSSLLAEPDRLERMGTAARRLAEEQWSWLHMAEKFDEVLVRLHSERTTV